MSYNNKNEIKDRARASTWAYVAWLALGGFVSLSICFFIGMLLTMSLVGVNMATQAFRLANYLLGGADEVYDPKYEDSKVKNTIWLILGGWFMYCFHMLMGWIFKITYVGRNAAKIWFDTAKIVAFPYGVDLEKPEV